MRRRPFSWVALVGVGLAGVVAVSAATALAARSAASPFELVFQGRHEPWSADCDLNDPMCQIELRHVGTFTSGAPLCESGTAVDLEPPQWRGRAGSPPIADVVRRYTCTDGSGSLTLKIANLQAEHGRGGGEWTIVEGSGRYAGLRGKGTYSGELLGGGPESDATIVFRTTSQGFADWDAVAPSVAFTSASATKLRRLPGAYLIRVALSLRDDVEGNPVAYKLKVTERRIELASREGTTASGSVSTTLRVEPLSKRLRSVNLHLRALDPVGNEQLLVRSLKLPR